MYKRNKRQERHKALARYLQNDPFATDEELAEHFHVSIPTIRLDRLALGIPEVRERVRAMAREAQSRMRGLTAEELVGELVELQPGQMGISILEIKPEMIIQPAGVAKGYYLFAQANSLALATIGAEMVVTGSARVRYRRPVYLHEHVVARALVKVKRGVTYLVSVHSKVQGEIVFKGQFIVIAPQIATGQEAN
ncbi:MAG: hypothetical protein PWP65_164 [Clostridia bacterium]|nr:hypothetical protein [Clostridia bacterium]